ncbi:MAG: ATP-binding cassette domain-containing protein, partial [Polaromonas sp.]|nr:ATP-binding cassette domain-containing protein [Polaromonas sp.]
MTQAPPLIRLRGITKVYGQGATALQALKGVNLDIEAGDFVAIMGPSGSGKSTAMNIIGCLDLPTSGSYLFNGVERAGGGGVAGGCCLAPVQQRQFDVFLRRRARQQVEALEHEAEKLPPQQRALVARERLHRHA